MQHSTVIHLLLKSTSLFRRCIAAASCLTLEGEKIRKTVAHLVWSLSLLLVAVGHSYAATPVHINFDNLQPNTIVNYQYNPPVTFSSENVTFNPPFTYSNCGYCVTSSAPNYVTSGVGYGNGNHEVILTFNQPVKNLTFYTVGSDNFGTIAKIDVWENGTYRRTVNINGGGASYYPLFTDLRTYGSSITKIRIYNIVDVNDLGFDDFDFTPVDVEKVEITSGRVGGILNNTTQKAMLGADVALQANIFPTGLTGGTYSWTATGPHQRVSATSTSASYTGRWTDIGTYQAKVTYTRNGVTVSATVNVNVVIPKLITFTATQAADRIVANQCGGIVGPPPGTVYILGCPPSPNGITFSATAQIPGGSYLSDPAQSGIKYVQIISSYRKQLRYGRVMCTTVRNTEPNVDSGWQLDSRDPYSLNSVAWFSQGNTITSSETDSPRTSMTGPVFMYDLDALYTNENFETYIVYFTGPNPSVPIFQRAIGLQNSPKPVARIAWRWGGQVVYDPGSPYSYQHQFSLVPPRTYTAEAIDSMRPYAGNADDSVDPVRCPDGPDVSNNPIDSSRVFVRQQYCDILHRPPDGAWIYWIRAATLCGFNQTCINDIRIAIARGFYESAEFRQSHPALQNPGAPGYNEEYVMQLYRTLLGRPPDGAYHAWVDILNQTGDYTGVVGGFINSPEYGNRFINGIPQCPYY